MLAVPVTIETTYEEHPELLMFDTKYSGESDFLVWAFTSWETKEEGKFYLWAIKSKYGEVYFREKTKDKERAIQTFKTCAVSVDIALSSLFSKNLYFEASKALYNSFEVLDSL